MLKNQDRSRGNHGHEDRFPAERDRIAETH